MAHLKLRSAAWLATLVAALLVSSCKTKSGDASEASAVTADPKAAAKAPAKERVPQSNWTDGSGQEWRWHNKKLGWNEAKTHCENLDRPTAKDGKDAKKAKARFRLPTPGELQDAHRLGMSSSKNPAFGWVYLSHTWTGTTDNTSGTRVAVSIDMLSGKLLHTALTHPLSVVCIRDTKTRDTWVDEQTGMVWLWIHGERNWAAADAACRAQAKVDRLPWRLAARSELDLAIKHGLQGNQNTAYGKAYIGVTWTGDSETQYGNEAYAIDLRTANHYLLGKPQAFATVCIRPINY